MTARAISLKDRLAILRNALAVAKQEGFARAEIEVSERGALKVVIDKGRAAPAEIQL